MRTRTLFTAATGLVATAAALTVLDAGTAAAFQPVSDPDFGATGVWLNPGETAAIANSPIPNLIDAAVPPQGHVIWLEDDSTIPADENGVFASDAQIIGEAASHPGGTVGLFLLDPSNPYTPGGQVGIVQDW
ncbi:hypothetical protein ACIP5Y_47255 [Nocardia sp. NPDC088792]|uniref:hypothetical protein n=1 Tax=Nocardia sp. NPDC088792 TaxID=3364332 RepID=UPI0038074959